MGGGVLQVLVISGHVLVVLTIPGAPGWVEAKLNPNGASLVRFIYSRSKSNCITDLLTGGYGTYPQKSVHRMAQLTC